MKKYKFRANSPYKTEDAQAIGTFLDKSFPNEMPEPKKVLQLAADKKSPLHKYFDWNDHSAANKYRMKQARDLLCALYIQIEDGSQIKAYENLYITESDNYQYVSINKIGQSQDLVEQVISQARSDLIFWKEKFEFYRQYFTSVFEAIEAEVRSTNGKEEGSKTRGNKGGDTANRSKNGRDNARRNNTVTR